MRQHLPKEIETIAEVIGPNWISGTVGLADFKFKGGEGSWVAEEAQRRRLDEANGTINATMPADDDAVDETSEATSGGTPAVAPQFWAAVAARSGLIRQEASNFVLAH